VNSFAWASLALAAEVSGYGMPTASVDTDDGFGAGARGAVAWIEEGYDPYKFSFQAVAYFATSGYQNHQLRFDRPGIGAQRRWRVTLNLAFRRWLYDRYYGIGNLTVRDASSAAATDRSDPRYLQYRYRLDQPLGQLTLRYALADDSPWELFLSQGVRYSVVRAYEGSLLDQEKPYGLDGGGLVEFGAGLLHDTRDPEIAPRRGHFYELSARVAPSVDAEAGGFGGALVSARWYAPLGGRVVVAQRVMSEWLAGRVPFYEMVHWGGSEPIAGFGGGYTLRGVPFGRWRGPGKAVSQTELRWSVLEHPLFGDPFAWELTPWVDVGAAYGAGVARPDAAAWPVHPGAGAGVRVIYNETFVGRVDTGWGIDPQVRPDGVIEPTLNWGVYVLADHPF
jgi:outer membrane protein assembly factor BamA